MPLSVRRHDNAREFLDRAETWLLHHEAENNLILGLAYRLLSPSDAYATPIYYATIENDSEVVGCALRTPPFKLLLTRMPAEAAEPMARDVAETFEEIPGVLGDEACALPVARAFCALRGGDLRPGKRERIYQLDRVIPPKRFVEGTMRIATMDDLDLVTDWVTKFTAELKILARTPRALAHERITAGSIALWEVDGVPVSMAGWPAETPNGVRIAYVYTPEELRGHGYATACVAALSQSLLDAGKHFCFLFTDLSNPTSNSIYQQIGYKPVCDVIDCIIEHGFS